MALFGIFIGKNRVSSYQIVAAYGGPLQGKLTPFSSLDGESQTRAPTRKPGVPEWNCWDMNCMRIVEGRLVSVKVHDQGSHSVRLGV